MNADLLERICHSCFGRAPELAERCAQGIGNYVYRVTCGGRTYSLRCSREEGAYQNPIRWLERLAALEIPVPRVLKSGCLEGWEYLLLNWLEGCELGEAYPKLTRREKAVIAGELEEIQRRAAALPPEVSSQWHWRDEVYGLLDRAEERIACNGYFDREKVGRLRSAARELEGYFASVPPVAYLDDVTTKNLLVQNGHISGVLDVDWMGVGDRLTYMALTRMALLNMDLDTDYADFLLEAYRPSAVERRAFAFYTLLYCVDFMGERGSVFCGRSVPADPPVIQRLNRLYDRLWQEWTET